MSHILELTESAIKTRDETPRYRLGRHCGTWKSAKGERSGRALASAGPSWTRKYSLRHMNGCRAGGGSGARGVTGSRAPSQGAPFCAAKGLAAARVLRREATARARGGVVLMVWAQRRSRRRRLGRRHPANLAWRTSPPLGVPTPGAYAAAPPCPLRAEGLWRGDSI